MKNLPQLVTTALKVFLILTVVGLMIEFWFILWVFISHHLSWDGFTRKYHDGTDFTKIWQTDPVAFNVLMLFEALVNVLKINLFLAALTILKKIDLRDPFGQNFIPLFGRISVLAFIIGAASIIVTGYIETSVSNDLILSTEIGESNYLWFAAIIYIATLVYEKGLSIKSENDLTI